MSNSRGVEQVTSWDLKNYYPHLKRITFTIDDHR